MPTGGTTTTKWNPNTKRYETTTEGKQTDTDLLNKEKLTDVKGAGLGTKAEAAKKAPPKVAEEDPEKMSPLQRASYNARKKREEQNKQQKAALKSAY